MVELTMDFNIPLVEGNEDKITLVCSIIDGNPANLSSVLWFQDTEQIMESIDCEPRYRVSQKTWEFSDEFVIVFQIIL